MCVTVCAVVSGDLSTGLAGASALLCDAIRWRVIKRPCLIPRQGFLTMSRYLIVGVLVSGFTLGGCGMDKVLPDKQHEYKKSQSLPDLEVPPDLSSESINDTMAVPEVDANGTATFSTYQERIA